MGFSYKFMNTNPRTKMTIKKFKQLKIDFRVRKTHSIFKIGHYDMYKYIYFFIVVSFMFCDIILYIYIYKYKSILDIFLSL